MTLSPPLRQRSVEGLNCDRCRSNYFSLTEENPEGCLPCFCSGVTQMCSEALFYRTQIPMQVVDDQHGFLLVDRSVLGPSRRTSASALPNAPGPVQSLVRYSCVVGELIV